MDAIRDVLRNRLGRSLGPLPPADQLAAAWLVICGGALAGHGEVAGYSSEGRITIAVDGGAWLEQFLSMRSELEGELARVAGVPVAGIHFEVKRESANR